MNKVQSGMAERVKNCLNHMTPEQAQKLDIDTEIKTSEELGKTL